MDLKNPIDISAVNNTGKKYDKELRTLDKLSAQDVLQYFTPMVGVTKSTDITYVEHGSISKRYNGKFEGDKNIGKIVPRTLKVYPVVAEMADEPERYRNTYISEVAGGLDANKHPFEKWLLEYGISIASEDLVDAIYQAKYSAKEGDTDIMHSFDGLKEILSQDVTAGRISIENKNLFEFSAEIDNVNIKDFLLAMWRFAPSTMKRKGGDMVISDEEGEMYDDWYAAHHEQTPNLDVAGQQFLEGTNKKCRLIRLPGKNDNDVILTRKKNMVYGTDKLSDMKAMKAFNSGNPYLFTAAMKYIFGVQFASVNRRELILGKVKIAG